MQNTNPSRAEIERLMEAARDARSAAVMARVAALGAALRRLLRGTAATKPTQTA